MSQLAAVHAALAEISEEERDTGDMRLATAVVHLAEGEDDQAADVLAPVIDGSAPARRRAAILTAASESSHLAARCG